MNAEPGVTNQLSTLQESFLRASFQREDRFFLTGGAALVGFYLGHRETHGPVHA